MAKLEDFFVRYARERGIKVAEHFAVELRKTLSTRAATRRTASGRLVAIFPALPYAPPRYVSGRLYKSVTVRKTARGATVVIMAPYGLPLEHGGGRMRTPHPFWKPTRERLGL